MARYIKRLSPTLPMAEKVDNRELILAFMRQHGPSLPAAIARELKTSLLFGSAHLAEMTATGKLKTSNLKIGGSPLYFIPGQEALLENFSQNLGEKDKRAYDLLKESKVLSDKDIDPLTRVALRNIKDFAVAINVSHDGADMLFWRWHSLSNKEVEQIFREMSGEKEEEPIRKIESLEPKEEKQKTVPAPIQKKEPPKQEVQKELETKEPQKEKSSESAPSQATPKKEKKEKAQKQADEFAQSIEKFFAKNGIAMKEQNIIKKNTEIEYVISIPSVFGNPEYYCRAKNKKRLTDSDVSNAYVQGNFRKVPVILLSNGDLNRKGAEVLGSLKGVIFFQME